MLSVSSGRANFINIAPPAFELLHFGFGKVYTCHFKMEQMGYNLIWSP